MAQVVEGQEWRPTPQSTCEPDAAAVAPAAPAAAAGAAPGAAACDSGADALALLTSLREERDALERTLAQERAAHDKLQARYTAADLFLLREQRRSLELERRLKVAQAPPPHPPHPPHPLEQRAELESGLKAAQSPPPHPPHQHQPPQPPHPLPLPPQPPQPPHPLPLPPHATGGWNSSKAQLESAAALSHGAAHLTTSEWAIERRALLEDIHEMRVRAAQQQERALRETSPAQSSALSSA